MIFMATEAVAISPTLVQPASWRPPATCLPPWGNADLPAPPVISRKSWRSLLGPGIVMMGVQIGGGEWLFGPEITARYGGGLMWLATMAIVLQVFYNLEVGRYALYCGEPIFTGFLRTRPGPHFWTAFFILLSLGAMVPGLAFHAAAIIVALFYDIVPSDETRQIVLLVAFGCTTAAFLPVLFGEKIYNTLQAVMTVKVFFVLLFCLAVSCMLVEPRTWTEVLTGFLRFGTVPSPEAPPGSLTVNALAFRATEGRFPTVGLAEIGVIGAFIGFAGGGGLGNSLYGNYVRDKGWGNGANVGAIPSAFGGQAISLSHLGKVFQPVAANLARWRGWWRVILIDQAFIWAPGCFVGMALPALLSLQFVPAAAVQETRPTSIAAVAQRSASNQAVAPEPSKPAAVRNNFQWSAGIVTAAGMRHGVEHPALARGLWITMLIAGLLVLLPSQMSVVDEVCRRWTDVIWSASPRIRAGMHGGEVKYVYYALAACYFLWCMVSLYFFGVYGTPRMMTIMIGNLGNLALGFTSLHILWINTRWLPPPIRPGLIARLGLASCGAFYLLISGLVFWYGQLPALREYLA
jgi:hypothetical protein